MTELVRAVHLPEVLCQKAELRFGARFGCMEDLLTFVLTELVADGELELDRRESELVEERLRRLGYV